MSHDDARAWSASRYLTFADERTRPAVELLARVPLTAPTRVVDLGCGPGNSTALLVHRFPHAHVTGVDNAPDMLRTARASGLRADFVEADVSTYTPPEGTALLFANAVFHWVDDHDALLRRLLGALPPGGVLAMQLPTNFDAPTHVLLRQVAAEGGWATTLEGALRNAPVHAPAWYAQRLRALGADVDVWETTYLHQLRGEDPVLAWVRGTTLVPVLARLDAEAQRAFTSAYAQALRVAYPADGAGLTELPFRRLFVVAHKR